MNLSFILKRNRIEIMVCILKNSNETSKDKGLLDRCNLKLALFNLYRDFLVEKGFLKISRQEGVEVLETTKKGKQFLNDYINIKDILEKMPS